VHALRVSPFPPWPTYRGSHPASHTMVGSRLDRRRLQRTLDVTRVRPTTAALRPDAANGPSGCPDRPFTETTARPSTTAPPEHQRPPRRLNAALLRKRGYCCKAPGKGPGRVAGRDRHLDVAVLLKMGAVFAPNHRGNYSGRMSRLMSSWASRMARCASARSAGETSSILR
jgi:hypothetical protein